MQEDLEAGKVSQREDSSPKEGFSLALLEGPGKARYRERPRGRLSGHYLVRTNEKTPSMGRCLIRAKSDWTGDAKYCFC